MTAVEFSRLFSYKLGEKEEGKWYVIIFTCASYRAVHLEVAGTQRADKFKNNLNALVTHQTRLVSSSWIMPKCLRSQRLNQDCWEKWQAAELPSTWENKFYLAKSPWWWAMCERLIKEIKKTLHKTLPRSHLSYEVFEAVLVDVERNLTIIPHPPWCMFDQKEGGWRAFPKHDPVGTKCVSSGRHWRLRCREANEDDQATRRCWRPRIEMLDKKVHVRPSGKPQA